MVHFGGDRTEQRLGAHKEAALLKLDAETSVWNDRVAEGHAAGTRADPAFDSEPVNLEGHVGHPVTIFGKMGLEPRRKRQVRQRHEAA